MNLTLSYIDVIKRNQYINILKLADDSEEAVMHYINRGDLYAIEHQQKTLGCVSIVPISRTTIEIMNISILPAFQQSGIGKKVLQDIEKKYNSLGYKCIEVGTANCSIGNIIFYQKCGYRMKHIKQHYFEAYEPFVEYGIQGIDMIVFEKQLVKEQKKL